VITASLCVSPPAVTTARRDAIGVISDRRTICEIAPRLSGGSGAEPGRAAHPLRPSSGARLGGSGSASVASSGIRGASLGAPGKT